jgi:serine protease inhibitor
VRTINGWVSDKTRSRIKDLMGKCNHLGVTCFTPR